MEPFDSYALFLAMQLEQAQEEEKQREEAEREEENSLYEN